MSSSELEVRNVGHFGFSAVNLGDLEIQDAATLFALVADGSGSTVPFRPSIIKGIKAIIEGTRRGPKSESIMMQTIVFASESQEFHGIKPLEDCNLDDYNTLFDNVRGVTTALAAANIRAIEALGNMGKEMTDDGYTVNGIVVVITDGAENASGDLLAPPNAKGAMVKKAIEEIQQQEKLESIKVIVIGVNMNNQYVKQEMEHFRETAGILKEDMQLVEQLTEEVWAKIVGYASSSVTSTSMALGTGAPSQSLAF